MLNKIEVKQFVKEIEPYIKSSSIFAANFFALHRISHTFWGETAIQLTPGLCEQIYKDLIEDALLRGRVVGFKYGLSVTVYQVQADPEAHCGIQLGMGFPYISKS